MGSKKKKKKFLHKKQKENNSNTKKNLETLEQIFETREIKEEIEKTDEKKETPEENNIIANIINQERQKRRNQMLWGLSIILSFCALAAVAGFFYFNQYNPFAEEKVELLIDGPQKALVGEEIEYEIIYENKGNIDINNSKLIIKEPNGFELINSTPEILGHSFDLGSIKAGQKGNIILTGTLIDNIEKIQTLTASLIFIPNNFNSEFSATADFHTALEPINFDIKISTPSNVTPGEKFKTEISYTYNGLYPIENYKINIEKPDSYFIDEFQPKPKPDEEEWIFENINPGDSQVISFTGHFDPEITFETEDDRSKEIGINLLSPNKEEQYFTQYNVKQKIKVVAQSVKTNIIINGSSENQNISLGDKLNITTIYKNSGEETYKDLAITLTLNSLPIDIIDWENINDPQFGRLEKSDYGKTITWSSDQIEELNELSAGEKGSINFSIPLKPLEELINQDISDVSKVYIEATTSIELLNENNQILPTIKSNLLKLGLNSNVELDIQALYYYPDGTQIGTGPLPPKADQTTKYVVLLDLTNQLHELQDIKIEAVLGEKIKFTKNYEQNVGSINYEKDNKKLNWEINRLPTTADNPNLTFSIELTPDQNDVDKLMKLIKYINLTATDTITQDQISKTYRLISTNLEKDDYAIGKGIVQE
jgi:uncharacterized repeat protein (TIGR01451 family)